MWAMIQCTESDEPWGQVKKTSSEGPAYNELSRSAFLGGSRLIDSWTSPKTRTRNQPARLVARSGLLVVFSCPASQVRTSRVTHVATRCDRLWNPYRSNFRPYPALECLLEVCESAETASLVNSTIAPNSGSNSTNTNSVVARVATRPSLRDGSSKRSGTIS
jgi:hypothetical protein